MYDQTQDVDEIVLKTNGNGASAKADTLAAGRKPSAKSVSMLSTLGMEADLQVTGSGLVELPRNLHGKVQSFMDDYKAYLEDRTELYAKRQAAEQMKLRRGAAIEAGEPTVGNYVAWDLLTIGPVQFIGPPPYRPHKIVASNEFAVVFVVLFVNPTVSVAEGFAIPATEQLGGRRFRIRGEQINLTNVSNGPDFTINGTFSSPAPVVSIFAFVIPPTDPGVNPLLRELNVTADIRDLAQHYAAFSTNLLDIDAEPGFLGVPAVPPQLQHDIPLRYMIYRF